MDSHLAARDPNSGFKKRFPKQFLSGSTPKSASIKEQDHKAEDLSNKAVINKIEARNKHANTKDAKDVNTIKREEEKGRELMPEKFNTKAAINKSNGLENSKSKSEKKTFNDSKPKATTLKEKDQNNQELKSKEDINKNENQKDGNDLNTIGGFPIHCSLCRIPHPFKRFTDVLTHLYGHRHRRTAYKMLFLDSTTSITFRGIQFWSPNMASNTLF